jgi:DDE superfamily endonuclease
MARMTVVACAEMIPSNQVTHFYSQRKNAAEIIKLMNLLLQRNRRLSRIYLSWDAASWHMSKQLTERIAANNIMAYATGLTRVETAPLPAGAQFLNVIESVFSGMARAIIHNSNYSCVDDAKAAIDRYFAERNQHFARTQSGLGTRFGVASGNLQLFQRAAITRTRDTLDVAD